MTANPGGKTIAGDVARPQQPPSSASPPSSSSERITVALIPKAAADLQRLQERSGLSKTDLTNRAISLYEFIDAQIREGREVLIRDPAKKETQLLHLFL
jgi:hypothetical protein